MRKHVHAAVAWVRALPLLYSLGGGLVVLLVAWMFWPTSVEQKTLKIEYKPFVQQVSVSGKVVPAQEVDLSFSQSGRITAVYAKVGQYVAQGTTLAVIENGDLRANLLQRQAALQNQEAKLASLRAGTRPEEVAVAQADVEGDTRALLEEINDAFRAVDAAVRVEVDQFLSNPRSSPKITFQISDLTLGARVENKRFEIEGMLVEWENSLAALQTTSDLAAAAALAHKNLATVSSFLTDAAAVVTRGVANTQTTQATLDGYAADVASARTNVNTSISAITSAQSALDSSKKTLTLKQAGSTAQDIAAQEAQVKAAEADVVAAQAQLGKTYITAPFFGVVTAVEAKVGRAASSGAAEISMISSGAFQIESYVPELNIALLAVGDKAEVVLDAYQNERFEASVVSLDPAETVRDGVSAYRAVLQFSTTDPRILSGMTASVYITTDTKERVLSVPQGLVVRRGGKAYVQVVQDKKTIEREVTVGAVSSLGEIEILSGLSAGEVILGELPK